MRSVQNLPNGHILSERIRSEHLTPTVCQKKPVAPQMFHYSRLWHCKESLHVRTTTLRWHNSYCSQAYVHPLHYRTVGSPPRKTVGNRPNHNVQRCIYRE